MEMHSEIVSEFGGPRSSKTGRETFLKQNLGRKQWWKNNRSEASFHFLSKEGINPGNSWRNVPPNFSQEIHSFPFYEAWILPVIFLGGVGFPNPWNKPPFVVAGEIRHWWSDAVSIHLSRSPPLSLPWCLWLTYSWVSRQPFAATNSKKKGTKKWHSMIDAIDGKPQKKHRKRQPVGLLLELLSFKKSHAKPSTFHPCIQERLFQPFTRWNFPIASMLHIQRFIHDIILCAIGWWFHFRWIYHRPRRWTNPESCES